MMVMSFVVCYAPYAIAGMYFTLDQTTEKDYRFVTIPAFFSKSSSVYNPLIYCFMNKQVRLYPKINTQHELNYNT